jgi:uncharacterized protein YjbI with pentapeptide repeats
VVVDRYAGSWFIVVSSVLGYDGARNVKAEERSVGRKRLLRKAQPPSNRRIAWPRWTGFSGMTLRDWLQLLIVPFTLVVIGLLFTMHQDAAQQKIEDRRAQQAQKIENQRAEAERELAEQRAQDAALQAYLHQMSGLMLDGGLRTSEEGDSVRLLARARTIAILRRLDSERNTDILQFLREAQLISGTDPVISLNRSNLSGAQLSGVDLGEADLREADLSDADLSSSELIDANLSEASLNFANLSDANLSEANLSNTSLNFANLSGAVLNNATLSYAKLSGANMSGAFLRYADLREAYLIETDLSGADLSGANLSGVILSGADLRKAVLIDTKGVSEEQLEEGAKTLDGATMPDGSKHL